MGETDSMSYSQDFLVLHWGASAVGALLGGEPLPQMVQQTR